LVVSDFLSYEQCNGFIYVVPFTELTSPNNSDIFVNVYVSSSDLMLQQPDYGWLPKRRLVTESADYHSDIYDGDVKCVILNKTNVSVRGMALHHFGEQPLSFRALLHRYVTTDLQFVGDSSGNNTLSYTGPNIPMANPQYGEDELINDIPPNLFDYLPYAFLGVRGGVRKRTHPRLSDDNTICALEKVCVTLGDHNVGPSRVGALSWDSNNCICDFRGSVSYVPVTNGGVEYELPFYSNNLFAFSFADDLVGANTDNDMIPFWSAEHVVDIEVRTTNVGNTAIIIESGIGDDFTFLRYSGAPFFSVQST